MHMSSLKYIRQYNFDSNKDKNLIILSLKYISRGVFFCGFFFKIIRHNKLVCLCLYFVMKTEKYDIEFTLQIRCKI